MKEFNDDYFSLDVAMDIMKEEVDEMAEQIGDMPQRFREMQKLIEECQEIIAKLLPEDKHE